MSTAAKRRVVSHLRSMRIKHQTGNIQQLAAKLNPIVRGWINYYCKVNQWTTVKVWWILHLKIIEWVRKSRKIGKMRAINWLRSVYASQPWLFAHWTLINP
nr:group II intron maturase-specific domain-containing protein [Chitinophaga sp. CF418]